MTRPAPLVEHVTRPRPYGKPAASATPRDEPTPPRRNQAAPPEVEPEPTKPRPLSVADFAPDAVRLHQHIERLAARDSASGDITRGRGGIGKDEFGRTPPGARPWWWCYGNQPIAVKGAVYAGSDEARHLVRGISEDGAQRAILTAALAAVGGDVQRLPPDQLAAFAKLKNPAAVARAKMGRRGKGRAA
jgi:hypothetical protein